MSLLREIKFGIRMLAKRPGTSALAVAAIALGIGLTTTMFSIVDGAFLRGLPFDRPAELVAVSRQRVGASGYMSVPPHDFADWKAAQHTFQDLAASTTFEANVANPGQPAERFRGARITANTLKLLGVQPVVGRDFTDADARMDAPPVVLISAPMWQGRFEQAGDIVGRTLQVNGVVVTVVGVMPPRFGFPNLGDIWVPERLEFPAKRGEGRTVSVVGRLKPGVSLAAARADMITVGRQLAAKYPENKDITVDVTPYTRRYIGVQIITTLSTMLGAVFGVLLIACVNVTNLQLARAAERMKETAVRFALGASRWRIIRQLLLEGLILSAAGGLVGLAIARTGIRLFNAAIADTNPPFWAIFRMDARVLLFVLGLTVVAALASSLIPALRLSGQDVNDVLKDEGRSATGLRVGAFSRSLVVVEMTLSFVLLTVSGLMIKSIVAAGSVRYPFETNVLTARMSVSEHDYHTADEVRQLVARVLERMSALPGVQAAAAASSAPDGGGLYTLTVEGQPLPADPKTGPLVRSYEISTDFLKVLRVPLRAGRTFTEADRAGGAPVALVSEDLARRAFPKGDAVGRRIQLGTEPTRPWRTIVGVVPRLAVVRQPGDITEMVLTPMAQSEPRFLLLLVAATSPPTVLGPAMRLAVMEVDPNLPIFDVNTLAAQYEQRTWPFRVFGTLFMAFGLAALIMSAAGLYGVMSFAVRRRTQEIGIRMALGADRRRIARMVARQGFRQVGLGVLIGFGFAGLLGSGMQALLFQVRPWEPIVFGVTMVVLAGTGLVATLIPALRAASVDPLRALRHD